MPSRQGTRDQGRRAMFVRNAKGKEEKVAREPPSVVRLFALPFSRETTMSILSFLRKFNILAIEFPTGRERGDVFLLPSFYLSPVHFICAERKQMTLELFGIKSNDEKLTRDSFSLRLKNDCKQRFCKRWNEF